LRFIAAVAACLVATACFQSKQEHTPTCLELRTCQCMQANDCDAGLDCVNGQCTNLHPDAGPGILGSLCLDGRDCSSALCLPRGPGNGGVCTQACDGGGCPQGWNCKTSNLGPPEVCSPPFDSLCLPCNQDSDCNPLGDLCLLIGGKHACGRDCSVSPCPTGYTCTQLAYDGGMANQCVPTAQTCDCSDVAIGLTRACSNPNAIGTCFGREACLLDGTWSQCDARAASREVCNGIDDDCNGLIDQNDPGLDVSGLPTDPPYPQCQNGTGDVCLGAWECIAFDGGGYGWFDGGSATGGHGWFCTGPDPKPEICNYRDDDCDGVADEPFKNDAGQYVDVHNCNACGYDCTLAIANLAGDGGAVACELRGGVPTCVPTQCATGSYLFPPGAPLVCEKDISSSCRPCASNADCAVPGDLCITVPADPGTVCAQNCDVGSPYGGCTGTVGTQDCCPNGYSCEASNGAKLCLPVGGSCECTPARVGITRSCIKYAAATNASCIGLETCTADAGWSACDTSQTIVELCDGQDNNCSGVIDGPFKNTKGSGTYDTDQHCGNCVTNCQADWSPTIQHAIGGCDAGPGRPPACAIAACTQTQIPGGGECRLDSDCGPGRFCQAPYYQCVRFCGTSADCGGNPCVGGFCTLSCTSDVQCLTAFNLPTACGDGGTCAATYQWVDADKNPTNGCECPAANGVVEVPDVFPAYPDAGVPYPDRNCDGVNGVAASSLFVWSGSASSLGTQTNPYQTIGEAIAAFNPAIHTAILVAEGDYVEQVVLAKGVNLYGGYSSDFKERDVVSLPAVIEAPQPDFTSAAPRLGSVNAVGITQPTVFAGFTVRGYDVTYRPPAGLPGKSSYGIYVRDSTAALVIANVHVYGGRGGDGTAGNPGGPGANGETGAPGLNSKECQSESCAGESQAGGLAGANPICPAAMGNAGAPSSGDADPQQYQSGAGGNGFGGSNGTYAHQDPSQDNLCKYDCVIPNGGLNGGPASDGPDGFAQGGGSGCASPAGGISGVEWTGGGGSGGAGGTSGTGGGGGGAGGCVINVNPPGCTIGNLVGDLGSTGGGGGAGGCGGSGGTAGGGGGGSFGVFVVFSGSATTPPVVQGNLIDFGAGGFGGNGGPGGYGGLGGAGGAAGTSHDPAWCAGNSGRGGRGGNGGPGSGGGGGCGGVAFGIAGNGLSGANYGTVNAFNAIPSSAAGGAGAGGPSPSGSSFNGGSGSTGATGNFQGF
jgi:hypothetical protein